jgi:hypothetical protein
MAATPDEQQTPGIEPPSDAMFAPELTDLREVPTKRLIQINGFA